MYHLSRLGWKGIDVSNGQIYRFWLESNRTLCEEERVKYSTKSPYQEISPNNPYKEQIEEIRRELEEPCKACMYTGVSVCVGLSLYFVKLATDDATLQKNRRFLWMCSAGSLVAGTYRWYLG